MAVLSHNAVLQELTLDPPFAQSLALLQKRKLLAECVSTLLLMGASLEAKVNVVLLELQVWIVSDGHHNSCVFIVFQTGPQECRTALHMAAEEANVELLRIFLDQSNYFSVINTKVSEPLTSSHLTADLSLFSSSDVWLFS